MDPYTDRILALLGDRDPTDVLRQTPLRLDEMARRLDHDWEIRWREGGWTGRQIVCHLADMEILMGFRMRQLVAAGDAGHVVQPADQDAWARDYARLDPALAVDAFRALRAWNLAWLTRMELKDWLRSSHHPERQQEETLDELVRRIAGHDLNHLAQLEHLAGGPLPASLTESPRDGPW